MNRDHRSGVKYMLAGGSILAALGLLVDSQGLLPKMAGGKDICQQVIQEKAVLSRDQLTQVLSVPERANKQAIRQVMKLPYCRLSTIQPRAGMTAEREAYPLAFDPKTWLIVLYEGDEYAGYSFSFRR
ncbi:hypothetical protein JOY44_11875 [Phormidium sp. CLA17]|uniref:hypothetical protein n=1 Tax=Leptolyngbya sp. Cla-17 TaxID=2803751 RepID=UPI001491D227|nr:hypothetical protein [Leptolyngbya sp. Cla-17]MBM0742309.1 hypothetical protein [Leptolyngbya sp. Cla-17]